MSCNWYPYRKDVYRNIVVSSTLWFCLSKSQLSMVNYTVEILNVKFQIKTIHNIFQLTSVLTGVMESCLVLCCAWQVNHALDHCMCYLPSSHS